MSDIIRSVANQKVKLLRSLADKKERDSQGVFIAEGANLVKDIPTDADVRAVFVAESKAESLAELTARFGEPTVLEDRIFQSVSGTVTPSGVLAIVGKPCNEPNFGKRLMVLDGVSDSGNVGTIIRTAASAGFGDVVLINAADPYSPKAVRASMGGIFKVRVHTMTAEEFLQLKYSVYVLDMAGEDIFKAQPSARFALAVGSEAHGVSDVLSSAAEKVLSIPMTGAVESLNASVSAAIAMYVLNHNNI